MKESERSNVYGVYGSVEAFGDYFEILSPRDRRLLFEELTENDAAIDEETQEFCRRLYRDRYQDKKDPARRVDNWLWKAVYLPGVYKRRKLIRNAIRNEADGTLKDLHLDDPDALSEAEKTILYHEFRNTAKRYLSTCSGANYGNRLFGLKKASPEDKKKKACADMWMASRGFALAAGEEERLSLWCEAFHDELVKYYPQAEAELERLENEHK
jgi:hypothetical protein